MRFLLLILSSTFLISSTIEKIPYDWVGQYGLFKFNGAVLFNSDWRSNNLFFDGTWTNFPTMYGELVETDFNNIVSLDFNNENNDSLYSNTEVFYKIGDFSLDQFSFNIEKFDKYSDHNIYAFKRSYTGFDNQYFNNSSQPIQQSYIASLSSKKDNTIGNIHIGHFNTFSNFPDIESNSKYHQIISTVNSHIQQKYGKFTVILSLDNFLQKLRSNHSLSITTKRRYLSRSLLEGKINFLIKNDWYAAISFMQNKRSIKTDSIRLQNWNTVSINSNHKNFNFFLKSGSINKELLLDYGLDINREIGGVFLKLSFLADSKPIHPYYHIANDIDKNQLIEKNISKIFTLDYHLGTSLFHSRISFIDGFNPLWNDNDKTRSIFLKVVSQVSSNFYFSLFYNDESNITYHTGGLGDWYGMDIDYKMNLFKSNMKLIFSTNIKNYNKRSSKIYFNPIEMVPLNDNESNFGNMTILNFGVIINLSSVTFQYNWINLIELLDIDNESEKFNKVNFNPMMPYNGWQKQISIVWHFLN